MSAIAVTIAGSDSGGGAGIQADLKSFSANGVYGASVLTALTAQNTLGVSAIHGVPEEFVLAQMQAVYSDLKVRATKIGMLSGPSVIEVVGQGLDTFETGPVILDPVMVAASGDPLLPDTAVEALINVLLPKADLITPNLHEGARMLGTSVAPDRQAMVQQAYALRDLGARAVLLKGGHGNGDTAADFLLSGDGELWLEAPRFDSRNTHGTGCTLSSAIAANMAKGLSLSAAVGEAKTYITGAIQAADTQHIGEGHGPVHHFYRLWPAEIGDC